MIGILLANTQEGSKRYCAYMLGMPTTPEYPKTTFHDNDMHHYPNALLKVGDGHCQEIPINIKRPQVPPHSSQLLHQVGRSRVGKQYQR